MEETPLTIVFDEVTKHIDLAKNELSPERVKEIQELNTTYRDLISLNADVPLAPNQINGRLSEQVKKLKESGNAMYKKNQFPDAIKMYSLAIEMALKRAPWEAAAYAREELSVLYSNRAQTYMSMNSWGEAIVDADAAIFLKRSFGKAHYRKGKCLQSMGRLQEAKAAYELGLELASPDGNDSELKAALSDVNGLLGM
ncbi:TPR-like protein [Lipomyces arxii]|uniref:TPR-like protein n=1 Tax=Lipomyces arxii TaxID=56418 RepID=UPI0034CF6A72